LQVVEEALTLYTDGEGDGGEALSSSPLQSHMIGLAEFVESYCPLYDGSYDISSCPMDMIKEVTQMTTYDIPAILKQVPAAFRPAEAGGGAASRATQAAKADEAAVLEAEEQRAKQAAFVRERRGSTSRQSDVVHVIAVQLEEASTSLEILEDGLEEEPAFSDMASAIVKEHVALVTGVRADFKALQDGRKVPEDMTDDVAEMCAAIDTVLNSVPAAFHLASKGVKAEQQHEDQKAFVRQRKASVVKSNTPEVHLAGLLEELGTHTHTHTHTLSLSLSITLSLSLPLSSSLFVFLN
jgi:hypothetical protein